MPREKHPRCNIAVGGVMRRTDRVLQPLKLIRLEPNFPASEILELLLQEVLRSRCHCLPPHPSQLSKKGCGREGRPRTLIVRIAVRRRSSERELLAPCRGERSRRGRRPAAAAEGLGAVPPLECDGNVPPLLSAGLPRIPV